MKHKMIALMLGTVLALLLFSGCQAEAKLDAAEDAAENRIDAVEDTVEQKVETPQGVTTEPSTTQPTITQAEAEAIALEHAGLRADQVTFLHCEYEIDDSVPQYDVEFHHDTWEYNYEIHAETGDVLSFERDD